MREVTSAAECPYAKGIYRDQAGIRAGGIEALVLSAKSPVSDTPLRRGRDAAPSVRAASLQDDTRCHGNEVRAALGVPLIESRGSLSADIGLTWKSSAIVSYYYGVPGVYEGSWALNPFVKLGYSRPLSSKWRLTAFVHYEHLGNAIADSPIVNARYVLTVLAGATYPF